MKPTLYILPNPHYGTTSANGHTPLYDTIELSLCGHFGSSDGDQGDPGSCTRIDYASQLEDRDLIKTTWSLYGHTPEGQVEWIFDGDKLAQALGLLLSFAIISPERGEAITAEQSTL